MGPLTNEQEQCVMIAERTGERLQQMLETLSDLVNAGGPNQPGLELTECSPQQLVEEAVDQVAGLAAHEGVGLWTNVPDGLLPFLGDIQKLSRVMVNLLGNAIKFTPPGGHVAVEVTERDDDGVDVVLFAVRDTGIGISADNMKLVFNEGVKLSQQSQGPTKRSTGLGLTFCKRMVEAHEGRVWLTSMVGKGSTFYFYIPRLITRSEAEHLLPPPVKSQAR